MAKRPTKRTPTRAKRATAATIPTSAFSLTGDHVERALLTGEHRGVLEDYFGEAGYAELRDLTREASTRSVRGGPRVLILPGIMGSTLGRKHKLLPEVYWFDPIHIAAGKLMDLRLNGGAADIEPLGVILLAYLKLKLNLKIGGYDADFHPFDWRRSIADSGRDLAARIREEGRDVSLVAHSMGGLVARAALLSKPDRVTRVIQLGTPNYGSFAPVEVLRATYDTVKKISTLDLRHSAVELCNQVFNTFPGLYQMLPTFAKCPAIDLCDSAKWPGTDPQPLPTLLKSARDTQSLMAPADSRFYLIAGVNQNTVTGVSVDNGEFIYNLSPDGDGTVPLVLAKLDGIPASQTYYVEAGHGSLPNNGQVEQAVRDLLATGKTTALPTERPPAARAGFTVRESELRLPPDAHRTVTIPGSSDVREMLSAVAAPPSRPAVAAAAAAASTTPSTAPDASVAQSFQGLVVGRRRQARIELRLANGSIADVDSRAYVLGTFRNVAPSGAARAIDAKLGGAISEFTDRRMISSNVGEIFAIPAGRNTLRGDIILFAGLGAFDAFNADVQQLVAENIIRLLARTQIDEFATVLIGGGTGQGTGAILQNLITGFFRGLRDADPQHRFRSITLCETDPGRYAEIKQEIYRLSAGPLFNDIEVTLDEIEMPPLVPRTGPQRGPDPAYLLFRTESGAAGKLNFRSSILSSGARAALITTSVETTEAALNAMLDKLNTAVKSPPNFLAPLDALGTELATALIPTAVQDELIRMRDRHLVVVHDEYSSKIPWELLRIKDWSPAAAAGLTHRYMADNLPVATWAAQRRIDTSLNVLLIANPTQDLAGADQEAQRIRDVAGKSAGIRLTELTHEKATRSAVLEALRSGQYDVLHYAGHAHFDPVNRAQSGLRLADAPLRGGDLRGLSNLPTLVFFNACESSRIRGAKAPAGPTPRDRVDNAVGLAEALLRSGVANFLGTYWPVSDDGASQFAARFYEDLLKGANLGDALQNGRNVVRALPSRDWADYVFYGSQDFALKEGAR